MLQQDSSIFHQVRICSRGFQLPDIRQCLGVLFRILDQDIYHKTVLSMLFGKVGSLFKITSLSAHRDSRLKVELEFTRRSDESIELLGVFELCVTIQQKRGMICARFTVVVEFLKVFYQVMYSLRVKELSEDLRRLSVVDCSKILLHGGIIIAFLIEVVSIFAKDDILCGGIHACFLRNIYSKNVEVSLI